MFYGDSFDIIIITHSDRTNRTLLFFCIEKDGYISSRLSLDGI
nr:MAG TPA: hypothetical protein [Caudoviricetes sp.]